MSSTSDSTADTAVATSSTSNSVDDYCWGTSCSTQWIWARWVIFMVFMLILLAFVITTLRINHMRRKRGQTPLRYISWLTPPSYRQSESQRRRGEVPVADYVPPYTEEANENDLGFYDADGVFHINSKAQPPPPPPPDNAYLVDRIVNREIDLEMQRPPAVEGEYTLEQGSHTEHAESHEPVANDNDDTLSALSERTASNYTARHHA